MTEQKQPPEPAEVPPQTTEQAAGFLNGAMRIAMRKAAERNDSPPPRDNGVRNP